MLYSIHVHDTFIMVYNHSYKVKGIILVDKMTHKTWKYSFLTTSGFIQVTAQTVAGKVFFVISVELGLIPIGWNKKAAREGEERLYNVLF